MKKNERGGMERYREEGKGRGWHLLQWEENWFTLDRLVITEGKKMTWNRMECVYRNVFCACTCVFQGLVGGKAEIWLKWIGEHRVLMGACLDVFPCTLSVYVCMSVTCVSPDLTSFNRTLLTLRTVQFILQIAITHICMFTGHWRVFATLRPAGTEMTAYLTQCQHLEDKVYQSVFIDFDLKLHKYHDCSGSS